MAAAAFAATSRRGFADDPDGELHILKSDLLADAPDETFRHRIRWHGAIKLQPDRLAGELGKSVGHLTIESEAKVGIDFLLELEEPLLRAIPKSRLDHDENGLARLAIHGESVESAWVFDAEGVGFLSGDTGLG